MTGTGPGNGGTNATPDEDGNSARGRSKSPLTRPPAFRGETVPAGHLSSSPVQPLNKRCDDRAIDSAYEAAPMTRFSAIGRTRRYTCRVLATSMTFLSGFEPFFLLSLTC